MKYFVFETDHSRNIFAEECFDSDGEFYLIHDKFGVIQYPKDHVEHCVRTGVYKNIYGIKTKEYEVYVWGIFSERSLLDKTVVGCGYSSDSLESDEHVPCVYLVLNKDDDTIEFYKLVDGSLTKINCNITVGDFDHPVLITGDGSGEKKIVVQYS